MRQGCPLSSDLFNEAILDLEKEMSKVQGRGANLRKEGITTVSYADDIVIMAESDEMINKMLKKLGKIMTIKGLELNVENTKIMCFIRAGGRKKYTDFFTKIER